MPQAVTHVLLVLILIELMRDYFVKDKKKFSLHYVLIAGIAALIPDLDIILYWVLYFAKPEIQHIHRAVGHNIFVPAIFLILFFIFLVVKDKKINNISKTKLKFHLVFLMIAIGSFVHLVLDATLAGYIEPFYPLSNFAIGLNLIALIPDPFKNMAIPTLDAIILVLWLVHEETRHKISSFI